MECLGDAIRTMVEGVCGGDTVGRALVGTNACMDLVGLLGWE